MGTDWNSYVRMARSSLKEDGMPMDVIIETGAPSYDIETGKTTTPKQTYPVDGLILNYDVETDHLVSPEDVLIMTHSGYATNPLPDLLNKKNFKIVANNKTYDIVNVKAVAPAGVVIIYKFQGSEVDSGE